MSFVSLCNWACDAIDSGAHAREGKRRENRGVVTSTQYACHVVLMFCHCTRFFNTPALSLRIFDQQLQSSQVIMSWALENANFHKVWHNFRVIQASPKVTELRIAARCQIYNILNCYMQTLQMVSCKMRTISQVNAPTHSLPNTVITHAHG